MMAFSFVFLIGFAGSTAFLVGPVFVFLASRYKPTGAEIDRTHVWVNLRTGRKIGPANRKQVYVKHRGERGWEIKIEKEKKAIINSGIALSLGIYGAAAFMLIRSEASAVPLNNIPPIIGGLFNIALYFFIIKYDWDAPLDTSMSFAHPGAGSLYNNDKTDVRNMFLLLSYYVIMALFALLLQVFFWLRADLNDSLKAIYIIVFSMFCLGLVFLVYRKIKPHKKKIPPKKVEAPITVAEAVPILIDLLKLQTNSDNQELIHKKLADLTGIDLGLNSEDWERWWEKKQGGRGAGSRLR